jgi:glucosamine-6-phosphate deaminase
MAPHLPSAPLVDIAPDRATLGRRAADHVVRRLTALLAVRTEVRVMFACAPSQNEFLAELVRRRGEIDWGRITAFHMDEYVGLAADHPASFRNYLRTHLLQAVPGLAFEAIRGEAPDPEIEAERYGARLRREPLDLICLGIGENGHIAFNDPPVADFEDKRDVKVVELDAACRRQQVNDGCFPSFEEVPRLALTVTIPTFRRARALSIAVPGPRKADAVRATLLDPVSTACPATILREHPDACLWIDRAAAVHLG